MSDIQEALRLLSSGATSERLQGARLAHLCAEHAHLSTLQERRRLESDSWVRAALDRTIERLQSTGSHEIADEGLFGDVISSEDLQAEALQEVSSLILHEISPQVRRLDLDASEDLGDQYTGSRTKASVSRLQEFLLVLRRVHEAAGSPNVVEFDLTDVISRVVGRREVTGHPVLVTREDPLIVLGDPDLVQLALNNGLANAIEASSQTDAPVIISFGRTDSDAWVSILDEGIGLPPGAQYVWNAGRTTKGKENHFGWGLTIARRSIRSLHGAISLTPREPSGAAFEIRWPT